MSNLGPQQQNLSYDGLLQVDGGISSTLKPVQDGMGNMAGLWLSSTGTNALTATDFVASVNGTPFTGAVPRPISDGFGDCVSVKDFGATGDGVTDDTSAIQNAIAECVNGATLYFPSGAYKITSTLVIPSNITIQGNGRNFGTTIIPVNCGLFTIDGSTVAGGWKFRIQMRDFLVTATNAIATHLIYIASAYNIEFKNIFIYDQPINVTEAVYVSGSNNIVFEDFISYGNNVSVTRAFNIDGATVGPVSIKLNRLDVESYNRGIISIGSANIDIDSPYMERCIVCYSHGINDGQTTIVGGIMSSINGYGINVSGPNLSVLGTDIDPYQAGVRGGLGINVAATTAFPNVYFRNIPRAANSGFLNSTDNFLTLNVDPIPISNYYKKTLVVNKTLTDNVLTNLYVLKYFDSYAKCKLTMHGVLGTAYVIKEYQFCISGSSTVSAVSTNNVLDTSGGNWIAVMSLTLTPDVGNALVTIAATVDTQGALGAGQPFPLFTELEIVASESGVGVISLP